MNLIESDRLVLCKLSINDAPFILELLNDPGWIQFIGDKGIRNIDDACEYILNGPVKSYREFGFGLFLVKLKKGGIPIGICGLIKREYLENVDVGFAFLPRFRGKGYAAEAAFACIKFGKKKFGLNRIEAITQSDNVGSIKVLEKIGLKFVKMITLPGEDSPVRLYGANIKLKKTEQKNKT